MPREFTPQERGMYLRYCGKVARAGDNAGRHRGLRDKRYRRCAWMVVRWMQKLNALNRRLNNTE